MSESTPVIRYAQWITRHPWLVILGALLVVIAAASGGKNLAFKTDYRVFFSADNPQLLAFEALEAQYTKNDNVMFILAPKDGNAFSKQTLQEVMQLTAEAWKVPFALRVDAVTNFQHTYADDDVSWASNGIKGQSIRHMAWLADRITRNEIVHISSLDDLPASAPAEREFFDGQRLRSVVCVPLISDGGGKLDGGSERVHRDAERRDADGGGPGRVRLGRRRPRRPAAREHQPAGRQEGQDRDQTRGCAHRIGTSTHR